MFSAEKRYLAFSLNENIIKLVQAKSSGVVEKIARATVESGSPEALGSSLKTLLNGFDHKASLICVIPGSVASSKIIEVPSIDPQEIKSIINLQISRHTPYSREEVLIGYINLGQGTQNNTKMLLVIAHRNVIKDRLTILEKASLNPDKILFVPEGMGRLYSKGLNIKKDAPPIGVIDIASHVVNFVVVSRGSTTFCRSIPIGINQLIEGPEAVNKLLEEILKSIAAYTGEDSETPIGSYLVTTDHDVVKSILPALSEGLHSDIRISPYVDLIQAKAVKNTLNRDFADDSFLDVIAPIASASKCEVNLMSEEMVNKKNLEKQSKEAIKTVIAIPLLLVLLAGAIGSKMYFKSTFLNQNLRAQFAEQRQEVQKLQEKLNKVKVVTQYLQGRMISLDIIREIYRVTPTQIYLNTVVLDDDGTLTLTGISASSTGASDSMAQVYAFEKALTDSSLFKNIKRKSMTTKKDNDKDVAAFELSVQVATLSKE